MLEPFVIPFRGSFQSCLLGILSLLLQTVLTFPAENVRLSFPGRAFRYLAIDTALNFCTALALHDVWVSAVRRWELVWVGILVALGKNDAKVVSIIKTLPRVLNETHSLRFSGVQDEPYSLRFTSPSGRSPALPRPRRDPGRGECFVPYGLWDSSIPPLPALKVGIQFGFRSQRGRVPSLLFFGCR